MSEQPQIEKRDADPGPSPQVRSPYRPPVLTRLGTLRDLTMDNSFGGPDGRPHRGTGRGGNFESADCGR